MLQTAVEQLASFRRAVARIELAWSEFRLRRDQMLAQQRRYGTAAEKVAENVVSDLLVEVLDWPRESVNYQVGYADIVVTDLGVRRLIIELKRPDALSWDRRAVDEALDQARRYADEQGVKCIAISDGRMLYAADLMDGGLRDRLYVALDSDSPPHDLWWLSRHAIYRARDGEGGAPLKLLPAAGEPPVPPMTDPPPNALLHPTYELPAHCFAYVGRADQPRTWKLPYLLQNGDVDRRRLPKAIQAILTNYRGTRVGGIPEEAVPSILERLAVAARGLGLMPPQSAAPAPAYQQLADALGAIARTSAP